MTDTIAKAAWRQVRIYAELGRAHRAWSEATRVEAYALLDSLLPALSCIHAVTVFDSAVQRYIQANSGTLPQQYNTSFGGRLRYLRDRNLLRDFPAIDEVRKRRNQFARDGKLSSWEELDRFLRSIETELLHLGILTRTHEYSYCVEPGRQIGDETRAEVTVCQDARPVASSSRAEAAAAGSKPDHERPGPPAHACHPDDR